MTREDAYTKGMRLLTEHRLRVEMIDDRYIGATCRGDRGDVYCLGFRPGGWYCECEANGKFGAFCSHLCALTSVVVRPGALPRTSESPSDIVPAGEDVEDDDDRGAAARVAALVDRGSRLASDAPTLGGDPQPPAPVGPVRAGCRPVYATGDVTHERL